MLYTLPSRELIADSVEYMVNAHCADALVCISNCDKITPGMLMAALRLNIPAIFVSGGPMEAGKVQQGGLVRAVDLVDAMIAAADPRVSDEFSDEMERSACPTCGSCSGMFTANSMNCLTEALGLALPGNGTLVATHADRKRLFAEAGQRIVDLARRYYEQDEAGILPRGIATFDAFENAMTLDIAMGGSTNTVLHLLAAAHEAEVPFTMRDMDRLSRRVPNLCKVAPRRRTCMWKTCTAPAACSEFWRNWIAAACCIAARTPCTRPLWAKPSSTGMCSAAPPRTCRNSIAPLPAESAPRSRSARAGAMRPWTWTAPRAPSAMWRTPSARMAASPCCTATSPRTAAS